MDKICKNCKHSCELKLNKRSIETIGTYNCISGVKIAKSESELEDSLCCLMLINKFGEGGVYEVTNNDTCENFEEKV